MATISGFKTIHLEDNQLSRFQQNVASAFAPITGNQFINGSMVKLTTTVAVPAGTDIAVGHGLGRTPTGIVPMVAQQSSYFSPNASFVQSASKNPAPDSLLILKCSADLKVGAQFLFWVF